MVGLGDYGLDLARRPLDQILAEAPGARWILAVGKYDVADGSEGAAGERWLFQSSLAPAIVHAGIRIAVLGGVFDPRARAPHAGDGNPRFHSHADMLACSADRANRLPAALHWAN